MEQNNNRGTYAAIKFDTYTNKTIFEYLKVNNIPNSVRPDQLHTTVLYSRKYLPDYKPDGLLMMAYWGEILGFEVWTSQSGARCLVLKYNCPPLVERHQYLMKTYEALYDFPAYVPHVTLSYDIGDLDITTLPDIKQHLSMVVGIEEYGEDLDLSWDTSTISIRKDK